jgi:sugar phosphate isomerase/epimerase
MKLALQDHPFLGQSFDEKLRKIDNLGFQGLEIRGDVLIEQWDEINKAVKNTGVGISSICGGYQGWIGEFDHEKRKQAIDEIGEILKYAAEIGAVGVIAPASFGIFSRKLPPYIPPRSSEEDKEVLMASLSRLNSLAESAGSVLLLEPLNRYEDYLINRLADAVSLIQQGEFSSIKVVADFFHMNIEESNLPQSILQESSYIGHVHLADSNRLQPGLGHIDFVSAFKALDEIGFDKFMALECELFGEPDKAFRDLLDYLKSCLPKF